MTEQSEKLFEFVAFPKRVECNGQKRWKLKVPFSENFPAKAVPKSNGSVTFGDKKDLYSDVKEFAPNVTLPTEYYKCDYTVHDTYVEFTGKTETCVRLGLLEYMKQYYKNLKMTMTRTWNLKGMTHVESDSEECCPPGIFDDEEW